MKLATNLTPLSINYPKIDAIPENLLNTMGAKYFHANSKMIPFREQYNSEPRPHLIKHIHYRYGTVNKKKAIMFYYDKKPIRLVYSNVKDSFIQKLNGMNTSKVYFPPGSVTTPVARALRESALKWVAEQFLISNGYCAFDEPILDGVNPDILALPNCDLNKILNLNDKNSASKECVEIELDKALFVEIKAYHQSSYVGEKEILQSFNYAMRGGKALLLTTGNYIELDTLPLLNNCLNSEKTEEQFAEFAEAVKKKFRALISEIDLSKSQDMFDNRGIYIGAYTKIKKMYKYTLDWNKPVEYEILNTPEQIMGFFHSSSHLGLVEPKAFIKLLEERNLVEAARLFQNIQSKFIEEIVIDPTSLYPQIV